VGGRGGRQDRHLGLDEGLVTADDESVSQLDDGDLDDAVEQRVESGGGDLDDREVLPGGLET
jgi:hypothetical protein